MQAKPLRHPGVGREEFRQNPLAIPGPCYRHGFEHYRRALARSTEACDNLHFLTFAVVAGLVAGRRAYIAHGRWLFGNIYGCLIGRTGASRKTTAKTHGKQLLDEVDPEAQTIATASWEGCIDTLKDGRTLMTPGEFRSLAAKAKQENSGLIPGLTDVYDCPPQLRHRTRAKDAAVERPFLSILTSSTPEWFKTSFDEGAVAGGFLNRWIFVDGEPKPPNPFPQPPDPELWAEARTAIEDMDERLRGYAETSGLRLSMEPSAQDVWAAFYTKLVNAKHDSELLAKMAERLQDVALKLALIYALLEGTAEIRKDQLEAGIAFADWERHAHKRVFEGFGDGRQKRVEDRILAIVGKANGEGHYPAKRTIQQGIGGGTNCYDFNRALAALIGADRLHLDSEGRAMVLV